MQTTCSIFNNNDLIATKKTHQAVYVTGMEAAKDKEQIYKAPKARYSYRHHLIEEAAQQVHEENAKEAEATRIANLEKKNRIINSQINKNQTMLMNKIVPGRSESFEGTLPSTFYKS